MMADGPRLLTILFIPRILFVLPLYSPATQALPFLSGASVGHSHED
jgi:hypothetical protein